MSKIDVEEDFFGVNHDIWAMPFKPVLQWQTRVS